MSFSTLPGGSSVDALQCSDPTIPSDGSNLVIKVRGGGIPYRSRLAGALLAVVAAMVL